jgi:hypothetical protein
MTSTYSLGTLGLVASYISTPYACAAGMLLNIMESSQWEN